MSVSTSNKEFVENLKFKGEWRSYQQRVLDELETHLDDKKLNVVAAPGAGKTTLGIEVMSRLKNNTLIFAPTITIRNQWKQRIIEGFLSEDENTDNISLDIKTVTPITISTYQALHSIYKNPEEREKFLEDLKKNNIKTLVLDEAHHLRTEWWATLNKLCEELDDDDFTIVSLTGTPPYDVSPEEWFNYHSLCGPVDAEISIPELVKNGDLCPHQDLIYFSNLSKEEDNTVFDFERNRKEFFNYINKSPDLLYAIQGSAFLNDLDNHSDLIFKNINFTLSLISYLLSVDSLSMEARILAEFLELRLDQIPGFDYNSAQTLFEGILGEFESYFKNIPLLKDKLKELKLLNGKKVDFLGEVDFKKLFARSTNKLDAIFDITKQEYKTRKKNLREVILLDYIGKGDSIGLNIFSVFDKLISQNINLGILTGTLIVIPETAKDELYKILEARNIDKTKVLTTNFCTGYLRVETYGDIHIVSIITELFEKGFMNVLTGTTALLGEGWDSPCVNTLIIASVVGSFMLSNQMRGRALRIDKNNPDKTANIWHLASVTSYENIESPDFLTIKKRFNTFEGISYKDNEIRNGIERFGKAFNNFEAENCQYLNKKMFEYAKDINGLKNKWNQVFKKSKITEKEMASQVYEVIESHTQLPETVEYKNFVDKMMGGFHQRQKIKLSNQEQLNMANALLKTLCDMEKIKTPYDDIEIKSYTDDNKNFCITLLNCTNIERNIFIKSFNELFVLDNNTRYLLKINKTKKEEALVDTGRLDGAIPKMEYKIVDKDVSKYLPVPEVIGLNQKYVKMFLNNLQGKNNKKSLPKQTLEESCLKFASQKTYVTFILNGRKKSILLEDYIEMVEDFTKFLNDSGALKKKYSDIEINAYKKNNKILLSFFNCSDYERNLIINNLCDVYCSIYYNSKKLKTKEADGITYFIVPQGGSISQKYSPIFTYTGNNTIRNYTKYNKKKYIESGKILPISMVISGVFSAVPAILLYIVLTESMGFNFDALVFSAVVFTFTYVITILPIDGINKLFLKADDFINKLKLETRKNKKHKLKTSFLRMIKNNIRRFIAKQKYRASLQKDTKIDIIFTKSEKNRAEVLRARYNTYLLADIKRSRIWF